MPRVSEVINAQVTGMAYMARDSDFYVICAACSLLQWLSQMRRVDLDDRHTEYRCVNDDRAVVSVIPHEETDTGYWVEGQGTDFAVLGEDEITLVNPPGKTGEVRMWIGVRDEAARLQWYERHPERKGGG